MKMGMITDHSHFHKFMSPLPKEATSHDQDGLHAHILSKHLKIQLLWNQKSHDLILGMDQQVLNIYKVYEPRHEKTNVLVYDLVRHKPGCTTTQDG